MTSGQEFIFWPLLPSLAIKKHSRIWREERGGIKEKKGKKKEGKGRKGDGVLE